MCGITGFIDFNKLCTYTYPLQEVLARMTDVLSHRGPDGRGTSLWQEAAYCLGFGHRRLAIQDLSALGQQPMQYAHLALVFNGEIYNFTELKAELASLGYSFKSRSDTEVILKAFCQWGPGCVERFIGMFAFALYDARQARVYLCRDRAGVKPLYYFHKGELMLFASELKSLYRHPLFDKEISRERLALYLQYGYIPAPHTIFKHTEKVLPGYYYCIDLHSKQVSREKYWDAVTAYNQPQLALSEAEAEAELERLLTNAVNYRLVADVPVGLFLSGGYDSSTVAALLQANRTEKIRTFTIGFREPGFDEAPYARRIAAHLGTEHTEYCCTQQEALALIPRLPYYYDEPFGDSSAIPTTLVSQLARTQVKVALSADAGDEVFAGYTKYPAALKYTNLLGRFPAWPARLLRLVLDNINPARIPLFKRTLDYRSRYERIKELVQIRQPVAALQYLNRYLMPAEVRQLLSGSPVPDVPTFYDDYRTLGPAVASLNRLLTFDYKTYLADDILVKVDRATMSVGLEGREPLLDHRLVEFMARLPAAYKIRGGQTKYLLKKIAYKYLPRELLDRPKHGFSIPVLYWLRDELKPLLLDYLNPARLRQTGYFNPRTVLALRNAYFAGTTSKVQPLWFLLMFEMWYEQWMK
jgi:asparagine synthase (glutamine-hydrolysing)